MTFASQLFLPLSWSSRPRDVTTELSSVWFVSNCFINREKQKLLVRSSIVRESWKGEENRSRKARRRSLKRNGVKNVRVAVKSLGDRKFFSLKTPLCGLFPLGKFRREQCLFMKFSCRATSIRMLRFQPRNALLPMNVNGYVSLAKILQCEIDVYFDSATIPDSRYNLPDEAKRARHSEFFSLFWWIFMKTGK